MDDLRIPTTLGYAGLTALSLEAREKLAIVLPQTLGQAARIPGVSASDLQNLLRETLRHGVSRETQLASNPDCLKFE
jgi:tRNA uridine 5-carboxymethylaminomethyl modification enzyme